MKTRVRPLPESSLYSWQIEIFDPHSEEWIDNKRYDSFWWANLKAKRLSKYSLAVKMNKKEEFVRKLKVGEDKS